MLYIIFAIYLGFVNLISLFLYGIDKSKAKRRKWRIKEAVLLGFGFFGGAVGALLGMVIFRHKTKHWYFWGVNFLGIIVITAGFWIILTLF